MATKPTVIFVHGAWHGPEAFSPVIGLLESAGYTTKSVTLPSSDSPTPLSGFEPDLPVIRSAVEEACDADQDVVLFMHSYGGVVGSQSIQGLDKVSRRKEGKAGGVAHLIYCTAFVLPEGETVTSSLGGTLPPWIIVSDDGMVATVEDPAKVFYHDVGTADEQAKWVALLKPFSNKAFSSKITYAAWRDVPSTYLFCDDDQALPLFAQKMMVENSHTKFSEVSFKTSHSPFLSMPEETANAVRRAAGETL